MLLKMIWGFMLRMGVMGMGWYTIDTINTAIRPKLLAYKRSVLFKGRGYVVETLYNRRKTEKINMFEVPLHFSADSNPQALNPLSKLTGTHNEIINKGYDSMLMCGDMAILTYEEFDNQGGKEYGNQGGADKFIDLMKERVEGKMDGLRDEGIRKALWRRTVDVPGSATVNLQTNGFYDVFSVNTTYGGSTSLHNLSAGTYGVWSPYVWRATAIGGTPSTRAGIASDPDSPVFLPTLIGRVAGYLTSRGVEPSKACISMGASLFDIFGGILMKQDHRVPDGKYAAAMGYKSINYKGFDVVEDDGMSENQTDNTDGWIAGIPLDDYDLFFNTADAITMGPFQDGMSEVYRGAKMLCYRQFCAHALNRTVFVDKVYNEKSFIPSF